MKRLLLLGTLLSAAALCLQSSSTGHGGTYRGPGDTVPPGGGGGGAGGAPTTPGPAGPTAPGPAAPGTPAPATPGAPPPAPGATSSGPVTPGGPSGPDLTLWDFWWGFNREPYLNLKSKIHSGETVTGSDDFFLGHGQKDQAKDSLRPSQEIIRNTVVPALKNALANERANDILDSALIALAKIGDVAGTDESEFEGIIKEFLKDGNQGVAETAAVALGILANDISFEILFQLATDDPAARRFIGKTEVPIRTRAYACYGLGLLGYRTSNNELRQDIAETLVDLLTSPHFSRRDIKVAAMTALGLTPLESNVDAALEGDEEDNSNRKWVLSRERQLDFLLDYYDPANERANGTTRHWYVRAHAPTAMARLLPGAAPGYKAKVAGLLIGSVDRYSKENREILMSATLALGQIGTAEDDGRDGLNTQIRGELIRILKEGDPQSRRFAMISLGQSGGTPGEGENALAGATVARKELLRQLSKGKTMLKPWAGLALGVMGRQLLDHNETMSESASNALRAAAADCKRPAEIGAYLIGIGIRRDIEGMDICMEKMDYFTTDESRGYCAVALGLIEDRSAIAPIQEIIRESKYKPDLLKQAAIALGLLGDKELVPDLIGMLETATGLATQAAISTALGAIGDSRSIDPLVELLGNQSVTDSARGFAAAALGIVCDKEELPWNTKISANINYRANTVTLTGGGTGILDLL
ncbi:MAG TPA: HEAT repeat domain-containing protein [Planctomycetes bacterium]|nr:HEAT repeat domain-containing protein [Planctomycetota bacterium]HIK61099.1 HEAT repeat domain-containing protein [Planctomycetota bacterium]